jgi:small subunit ribosomal protein S2
VAQVGIKELLEAGVHFGHQTRRWNPKMRRFIFGERDGIYIIDLEQTEQLLEDARRFAADIARRGGTVMFVGTKKQARDTIKDTAESADMPYVNHRWLGGLLTNFQTISARIKRLHDLERYESDGQLQLLPTRERMAAQADLEKLRANLGGVKNMQRTPDAIFVIDLKTEAIAVKEAQRLRIPIIGLVDTNCDPEGIDFVIPGNDDAIRSCSAITKAIGDVVSEQHGIFRAEEERARIERERREAEERARREAEEKARREAEEKARQEAEEKARQEAEEKARAEAEAQAKAEAEAQAAAQAAAAAEAEAQAQAAAAAAAEAQAQAQAAAAAEAQAQAQAAAATAAEAEAAPAAGPAAASEEKPPPAPEAEAPAAEGAGDASEASSSSAEETSAPPEAPAEAEAGSSSAEEASPAPEVPAATEAEPTEAPTTEETG